MSTEKFLNQQILELREQRASLMKQLDERNEATKVWIQAETQTRAYANKLEQGLEDLRWFAETVNQYVFPGETDTQDAALLAFKKMKEEIEDWKKYQESVEKSNHQNVFRNIELTKKVEQLEAELYRRRDQVNNHYCEEDFCRCYQNGIRHAELARTQKFVKECPLCLHLADKAAGRPIEHLPPRYHMTEVCGKKLDEGVE
jgi:rubrerythrin